LRDEVNEPLGTRPPPPSFAARHGAMMGRLGATVAALAVIAGAWAIWRAPAPRAGQPYAVARVEQVAPPPIVAPAAPPPSPRAPAPSSAGGDVTISSAEQVEASSGVKVVRNGGGGPTSSALIIDVGQALGVRLTPAPDKRVAEKSRFGLLPRVGADGARPSEVYARPVVETTKLKGAPRIAILVGGVGIDGESTSAAISRLPAAVSLGVAPYGNDLEHDAARAREAGHEILLQAPMEPIGASANPGPHTLSTTASEAENRDALQWQMGRFTGYIGVTNYLGGKLTADRVAFSPILAEIAARGLDYVDDGSSPRSLARDIAPTLNLPETGADVVIDASPAPEAIDAALVRLEAAARRQGSAIGVASALPVSIDHIARWTVGLEARGLSLAPVSALISRGPSATARATP
jgi:polysaccharide deacetylase 2 family uncharacterized protein YibQ